MRSPLPSVWLPACLALLLASCAVTSREGPTAARPFPVPRIPWNPRRAVIYRTDSPPMIDGNLDDAPWQAAAWSRDFVDIEGGLGPPPRFRTRVKMLWDDDCFYVAAWLEEPHVWAKLTRRDSVIYHDNDFEIFIDPDGDTHLYYELEINALGTEWDLLLAAPYRDGGPAIDSWDIAGLRSAVQVDGTLNDPSDRDRGWSLEIALPWSVLEEAAGKAGPPEPGDQWRLNFSRVEWRADIRDGAYVRILDPPPGRSRPEDNWVWSPQGLINMHYPEMWGIVQFSGRVAGDETEAFARHEEDRVKWILRQIYYRERSRHAAHGSYSDDLEALGLGDLPYPVRLVATPSLFEASITLHGETLRIAQDGRVW
ncbi:MAG: carbohydrate-binding family 9-like protein [Planctomycetota bacterium]